MEIEKIAKEQFEVQLNATLFSNKYTLSMDDGENCIKLHLSRDELLKIHRCIDDFVSITPELQIAYKATCTPLIGITDKDASTKEIK